MIGLKRIKRKIRREVNKQLLDWDKCFREGNLTKFMIDLIYEMEFEVNKEFDFVKRENTIVASFNERTLQYLFKYLIEKVVQGAEVYCDVLFKGKYPDIRVEVNGKTVSITEIKFYLKNSGINDAKDRKEFFKDIKFFSILQFRSGEVKWAKRMLGGEIDFIYLMDPKWQIKKIENAKGRFWTEENKSKTIAKISSNNAIEQVLHKIKED